jgi:UDP-3-O-[3-hydroxymyristoyl] glucosamine N-acyltransferase
VLLDTLAKAIGARLLGDGAVDVTRVRAADEAREGDLAFAAAPRERRAAFTTRASALLVEEDFAADHAHQLPCAVLAASPAARALVRCVELLHPAPAHRPGVAEHAVVDPRARLGSACSIGPLAVVGRATVGARVRIGALVFIDDGVTLGDDCVIEPGAVLMAGVTLGARVRVGPGTVIGDEGFVYAPDARHNVRMRHVASVVVGDDVDIGANACIDRGALRDTRIGRGTKVDNLAQVAHDVVIGEDAIVVAQVGIAGDARIGDGAVLAGQSGVNPRVVIGPRARIGGQAGATHDVAAGAAVSGTPAFPHLQWLKAMARLKNLDALERRVRALEARTQEKR